MHNPANHATRVFPSVHRLVRPILRLLVAAGAAPLLAVAAANSPARVSPEGGLTTAGASGAAGPIAVADILTRADEDQQRVDRARRLLDAPDPAERLAREYA